MNAVPNERSDAEGGGGGLTKKGLGEGSISTFGAVIVGLSCCAPAYTMTAALGPAASQVDNQLPAIFIIGFIPMFLVGFKHKFEGDFGITL